VVLRAAELLPTGIGDWIKQMTPPWASFVPAVIGLGLFTAARVSEQVRAGIQALSRDKGQAGTALGLTLPQRYRSCCCRWPIESFCRRSRRRTMNLIKNTSVALTIGLVELTAAAASHAGVHVPGLRERSPPRPVIYISSISSSSI
jgi:glutamate/aspartate transport system permease protein